MPTLPLRVRNLSPRGFDIVLLEVSENCGITKRNFSTSRTDHLMFRTKSTSTQLPYQEDAKLPVNHELNVHVNSFSVTTLNVDASSPSPDSRKAHRNIELTIRANNEEHCLNARYLQKESQILRCLGTDSLHRFYAITIWKEDMCYVFLYEHADLSSWMKRLKDETTLNALSIPGTHNSPTCFRALPSVRCQVATVKDQLENGIRFLDVRVQPVRGKGHKLILVHSKFPISFTGNKYFHHLLADVVDFLDRNPSETIIMSIKREGVGSATDADLAQIVHDHYTTSPAYTKYWYVEPTIPSLRAVRGKIVLLRRFRASNTAFADRSGIDAETWPDSTPYDSSQLICVQDYYQVLQRLHIERKIDYIKLQLARTAQLVTTTPDASSDKRAEPSLQQLHLNFLSGSNFWRKACWPDGIAKRVNPQILEHLVIAQLPVPQNDQSEQVEEPDLRETHVDKNDQSGKGEGGTGIVICDWIGDDGDWDLVRCIIAMNSKATICETRDV